RSGALAEVQAEMVSDLETPKANRDSGPGPAQLHQIERLNQMRRIGTLTEAEFARAKRDVLNGADLGELTTGTPMHRPPRRKTMTLIRTAIIWCLFSLSFRCPFLDRC